MFFFGFWKKLKIEQNNGLVHQSLSTICALIIISYLQALDKNRDGFISRAEFSKLTKNLSRDKVSLVMSWIDLNNAVQVEAVLAKFDSDGDGKLDYEEFKKLIQKKKKWNNINKHNPSWFAHILVCLYFISII